MNEYITSADQKDERHRSYQFSNPMQKSLLQYSQIRSPLQTSFNNEDQQVSKINAAEEHQMSKYRALPL